ncbi:hypothetical protein PC121_g16143 [Phytophthora cactorum]|nr:hypothetical protein PC120_g20156 [Phytophthora cactorum]KAG3054737.1 hypothetical protein PC121_g16143 [Phytophthora cactorum]KAG4046428.1 hypothetical protein PC123_g18192 [Phytophthora cactorum]
MYSLDLEHYSVVDRVQKLSSNVYSEMVCGYGPKAAPITLFKCRDFCRRSTHSILRRSSDPIREVRSRSKIDEELERKLLVRLKSSSKHPCLGCTTSGVSVAPRSLTLKPR